MNYDFLTSAFSMAHIPFTKDEPMASKTTFKVGGTAALYVKPQDASQLQSAIGGAATAGAKYFILGGGSNVVFPDGSYDGVIISTAELNAIILDRDDTPAPDKVLVTCQAGTPMAAFVNFCTSKNLSGAEQFAGLPGSVGGAVYMNARCFERSISDFLYQTEHIDFSDTVKTKIVTTAFNAADWDYKKSPFQSGSKLITAATFVLTQKTPADHAEIEADCKKYIAERVDKGHFKYPSAGSVFKNNHEFGAPSGKLIDQVGLKGYSIGGAQVAPFHGNFIINTGNATASQIHQLVQHIQSVVKDKLGFQLEPEIIFIK